MKVRSRKSSLFLLCGYYFVVWFWPTHHDVSLAIKQPFLQSRNNNNNNNNYNYNNNDNNSKYGNKHFRNKKKVNLPVISSSNNYNDDNNNNNNNSNNNNNRNVERGLLFFSYLGYTNLSIPGGYILFSMTLILLYKFYIRIPIQHVLFAFLYPLYLGIINRFRFQCNLSARSIVNSNNNNINNNNNSLLETIRSQHHQRQQKQQEQVKDSVSLLWQERGRWFVIYIQFFGIVGLLIPYIICLLAPTTIAMSAVPHTFLILVQVINEDIARKSTIHTIPKLLIPIGFNAYRIKSLLLWIISSWNIIQRTLQIHNASSFVPTIKTKIWMYLTFSLGTLNFIIWMYNLCIFLLLRVLPQYWNTNIFPVPKVQWKGQLIPSFC